MTVLEIVLIVALGFQSLLLLIVGAALWHQERLVVAQLKWFQDQAADKTK